MEKVTRLRAVVFDFDGTLARPALDFVLMKRRIGDLGAGYPCGRAEPGPLPALEWIERLAGSMAEEPAGSFRREAHAIIEEMEAEAASRTSLFGFTRPILAGLRRVGVAPAVITRNTRASVATVFPDAGEYLSVLLTREDVDAVKPDPAHLLAALGGLGVGPEAALMVGDHPLDVLTARRAGAFAAAVASGESDVKTLADTRPDFLAAHAGELVERLAAEGWI